MRILTIVFNLDKGGTQRVAQNFAEGYFEIGHDSKILSVEGRGIRSSDINPKVEILNKFSDSNFDYIKKWNPELIHIHSHGVNPEIIFEINKYLSSASFIETNVFSRPSDWESLLDYSFQLSNWCSWLYKIRGGNKYKNRVLPNSINCDDFHRASSEEIKSFKKFHSIPKEGKIIGRIGQSFDGKWSEKIIGVFESLYFKNNDLFLVLVNPPEKIIKNINHSSSKCNIRIIDRIIGNDLLSIAYSSMEFMLHIAEQGESFGLVLCEAMLCGTPIVTLSTPWADNSQVEVVNNNVGGLVVNKSKHLIKACFRLIDHEIQFDYGDLRKNVADRYNYLKLSSDVVRIYKNKETIDSFRPTKKIYTERSLLIRFCLAINNDRIRILTKYFLGYSSIIILLKKKRKV